jgi:hypothetical protein
MSTASLSDRFWNFAADRPWCLCLIITAIILIGCAIPGQVIG